jgi:hypothetical protein
LLSVVLQASMVAMVTSQTDIINKQVFLVERVDAGTGAVGSVPGGSAEV